MWTVPVLGQSARELRDGAGGFEVSPDGTHIAFTPAVTVMSSQGDNPQKALSLGENEWLYSAHWSPDGQRLAYIKGHRTPERYEWSIETCNPKGTDRTVVVPFTELWLRDFCWLPDRRIVYSRHESLDSNDDNLWAREQAAAFGAYLHPTAATSP